MKDFHSVPVPVDMKTWGKVITALKEAKDYWGCLCGTSAVYCDTDCNKCEWLEKWDKEFKDE